MIEEADRIMAATPAEAAQLVGLYRADPERIRLVPPGVDHGAVLPARRATRRGPGSTSPACGCCCSSGRLQAHKGPDVAVRALAEALARDPHGTADVVLAIVGGPSGTGHGAEVARLMDLAGALGVEERVMLFPPQPQARLADFYAAAEVVLVPSRSESFGLVALEAQACGTPVVASAVGGLRYVVDDGVTGFLVEGHDPARPRRRGARGPRRPGSERAGWARRAWRTRCGSRGTPRPARSSSVYRELLDGRASAA